MKNEYKKRKEKKNREMKEEREIGLCEF